ncbi:MAG: TonB-dependent receptor [Acidobacteriota bacterium]
MKRICASVLSLALALGLPSSAWAGDEDKDKDKDKDKKEEKLKEAEKKVGEKPSGSASELEDEMEFLSEEQKISIVVTASKHGQKITEAPAAVTVISSEDIEASGALTVADLFRRVPGLDFMQVSARDYNFNARGFNNTLSRRLLVLVDGRTVYLDLLGFTPWDLIQVPIDDIERIEVVRGPGSALYGANASSGVVNIITKTPKEVDSTSVRLGYGEFSTADVGLLTGRELGKFGYKFSAGFYQTDAFDNPDKNPNSQFSTKDEVATKQPKGTFRMQYDVNDDSRWVLDAGYASTSGTLYTGIGPLDVQDGSNTPFMRTSYSVGNLYFQAFWNRLDGDTVNLTSLQKNFFKTNAYDFETQYNVQAGDKNFIVVGGEFRYSDLTSDLTSQNHQETYGGVYGQDEIKFTDTLTGNVAFRLDRDELVGAVFAPKAGLVWSPSPNHSFRLTASTAYNSSSFIESYLDYTVKIPLGNGNTLDITATGNENLDPEKITSYELGYRAFPRSDLLLDINVYHAKLKDFVQFIATEFYDPPGNTIPKHYTYINAGDATEDGVELSAEYYATDHLSVYANYSYTDTNQPDEVTDVISKSKAGMTVQYTRKKGFNGSIGVNYSDKLEFPASTAFYTAGTIPSFTVVNGAAFWRFLEDGMLSVGLRGTNLFNKKHREFIAGDIIERKVLAEVSIRF